MVNATVIDGRGHLLGRLASTVAKELLNGNEVSVVRCESINLSGNFYRNKLKFMAFMRKKHLTNPKKGQFHFRRPSKVFWRTVRGMIPHKTARGQAAMDRLKSFDGCPAPYDKQKKMVVPAALRVTKLRPDRKYCTIGRIAHEMGWAHQDTVATLEAKRAVKAGAWYEKKKAENKLAAQAVKNVESDIKAHDDALLALGY
eukprot:gene2301-24904_t